MAMNADVLGLAIANEILAGDVSAADRQKIISKWTDIADVILSHIKTFGVISTSVTGTVTGVCATPAGPGTISGSATGTGTGTIA